MNWQRIERWRLRFTVLVRDISRLVPEAYVFYTSGLFCFWSFRLE
jgi:hypothetical protein